MVIQYDDILELITFLAEKRNIQVTVRESGMGGFLAGTAAALGNIVIDIILLLLSRCHIC